jgi:uncharacterized membrane protein
VNFGPIVAIAILIVVLILLVQQRSSRQPDVDPRSGRAVTITRAYRGSPAEAAEAFQRDASRLAADGYHPVSQIYSPGSYGCGAFLLALLLFVILIGILIFIYMIIVKPAGTLVVTYELRPERAEAPRPLAPGDPASALASLATMRDQGHVTAEEYEAKKAELLGRM